MMTVDPTVLGGAVVGLVTLQLTSLGILVAVLRFFYRRLDRRFAEVDRRFAEAGADLDRRFGEVRTDIDRRFTEAGAGLDRRFGEVRTDIDRRFAEGLGAMQAGFAEARDDRRRLAERLDEHGKEVARLQGIVERTYEPHRFTVGMQGKPPAAARGTRFATSRPVRTTSAARVSRGGEPARSAPPRPASAASPPRRRRACGSTARRTAGAGRAASARPG